MRKKDRKALGRYLRATGDSMELRDWTFVLEHEPCDGEATATVTTLYGRKTAYIKVCPEFRERTPEEQRHAIAHELMHCHFDSCHQMVRNDLEKLLGKPADTAFYNAYLRQFEHGIDASSAAIAKHLPMIEWPD